MSSEFEHEMPGRRAARTVEAEFLKVVDHTDHGLMWNLNFNSIDNRKH